jgi:histidinol-phosphate/aromatic aminotransferase/cobyric acid decarboxylase-like protein
MSGYNLSSYLRVSLGTEEENMIFIKELKSFIDN